MTPQTPVRILVIDDEGGFAWGLAFLLRRDGYLVDIAANGQGALALLQTASYDVLLCDLLMSTLDGVQFYDILLREYAVLSYRVIFLTGALLHEESAIFLKQCGQPWLAKPFRVAEVRRIIQQMLSTEHPQMD
jgi:CheY-like chemotaxis protein